MKNQIISLALIAGLAACSGGNPYTQAETDEDGNVIEDGVKAVPEALAQSLNSFSYNPVNETLTIVGVPTDSGTLSGTYRRRPAMDREGYEAYTAQDGSLDRHITAYVRDIRGTKAVTVVSGGQFEEVIAGNAYSNTSYTSPGSSVDRGLVTYAGTYVGLLNGAGSGEDLLPVTPGTPPAVLTDQAAEITGKVVINGDFADNEVAGIIYDRRVPDVNVNGAVEINAADPFAADNIALDLTKIEEDGTFAGNATRDDSGAGTYGGIFGGNGATEVAGAVVLSGHIPEFSGVVENGVFVLSQCGQADEDRVCNQPVE